jgi:hypothetical protein
MSNLIDLDRVEFLKVDGNKEFNHGVDCCINALLKQERVQAIPLDKVKQTRETIQKLVDNCGSDTVAALNMQGGLKATLAIIDKLIAESEKQ